MDPPFNKQGVFLITYWCRCYPVLGAARIGQAQLESNIWCRHIWAWMLEAGSPRDRAGAFICVAQLHRENAPCNDKALLYQLTVLGQGLVERPGADVDGDEDEENQEQEEAGCRGGRGEELHPQRSLPQPQLAGLRRAPHCHGNRPPRTPAFMTGEPARADTAPTPRQRAALLPRPHRPRRKSRSRTTPGSANRRRFVSVAGSRPLGVPGGGRCETGPPTASSPLLRRVTRPGARHGPQRDPLADPGLRRQPSHPAEGGGAVRRPPMEDVRGPRGRFVQSRPKARLRLSFLPSPAGSRRGGREGAYKDIYPESWLLEHFLNTPSVPGGIHVLQEDDVWVINRDNRGASEMLASRSRACAVLRATRPPWGRAGPSAPARLSALV